MDSTIKMGLKILSFLVILFMFTALGYWLKILSTFWADLSEEKKGFLVVMFVVGGIGVFCGIIGLLML